MGLPNCVLTVVSNFYLIFLCYSDLLWSSTCVGSLHSYHGNHHGSDSIHSAKQKRLQFLGGRVCIGHDHLKESLIGHDRAGVGVCTESWILKKRLEICSNFPDLEKVWKMEIKSGKMLKSLVFFSKLEQVLYNWIFFHFGQILLNLVCIFPAFFKLLFITY